ncbi:cannabinoid receptor 2 [Tachyglossus aculeatus]|uniref:cannabinoid receptor 2 n=1 Tax=Tachyglossus aculeatus TaxID=9261 RepID=UPI0018F40221|nr:cannabinoid receptor 2 [Tachyglossus aculeatus]
MGSNHTVLTGGCPGGGPPNASPAGPDLTEYMVLSVPQKTAVAALYSVAGALCSLENAAVLFLIASCRHLRRKPSYLFLGSLAGADLLAGPVFVCSFVDFHVLNRAASREGYLLKLGGVTLVFTGSVGSLLLTAGDRYLCLGRPARYKALLTPGRAVAALAGMWLATAALSFLPLLGWGCCGPSCSQLFPWVPGAFLLSWIVLLTGLLLAIVLAYAYVLRLARRHAAGLAGRRAAGSRLRLDVQLAKTLGLVLALLIGCWAPVLAFMAYSLAAPLSGPAKRAFAFCSILCLLNSAVNPVVYALRSGDLRTAARRQLAGWRRGPRGAQDPDDPRKSSATETEGGPGA